MDGWTGRMLEGKRASFLIWGDFPYARGFWRCRAGASGESWIATLHSLAFYMVQIDEIPYNLSTCHPSYDVMGLV